jgi:preprotein translocase subunit SecF
MTFNVVKLRWIWYSISAVTILGSLFGLFAFGLRQGIEFTGGSLMAVRFEGARPSSEDLSRLVAEDLSDIGGVIVQPVGETDAQLRLKPVTEEQHQALLSAIRNSYGTTTELRFDAIGPVVGEELRTKSIRGLIIVLLAIMAYVAYTFRKVSAPVQSWKYGLITIFAGLHDIIVPVGVFAFLGHFYGIEIGTSFIAALLTILGYSITDTIVVMDRIRENLQRSGGTFEEIVTKSVRQTFLRSFNTSATTLLTLTAVHFFGGESLRDFTLTLMIGIGVGTYSSIFIASPLLVTWEKLRRKA